MKTTKRIIAVVLTIILVSGTFVCFAADSEKQYHNYDKVLLLGDSEASGFTDYGDEMSEFTYVPDSYAAYVANHFDAELIPMACPGFRTIELRYMLDDSYRPDDKYLFDKVPRTPKDEIIAKTPQLRQAVAESDLILIGIGGNDWGAYLGWIMADVQLEHALPEEYRAALREFLATATLKDDVIGKIIELADYLNSLDELMVALPEAMNYAFSNLRENWNYIVEYIYENNPDVTLAVIGMFPTYFQTEEGAPDVVSQPNAMKIAVEDAIIAYGNKPMLDNQEKYGYIYVDTAGTIVELSHPTVAGHRHIANRILEELPDARCPYTDVPYGASAYKAAEYLYINDIMKGIDETTFGGETKITKAELSQALNKVYGTYEISESTDEVLRIKLGADLFNLSQKKSLSEFFNYIIGMFKMILSGSAFSTVTRAEAAIDIYQSITK